MLLRFIIWLIIGFIIAKLVGAVLRSVRETLSGGEGRRSIRGDSHRPTTYREVEDVDYEELKDKR